MHELYHQIIRLNLDTFLKYFNQYNFEDKKRYLAQVHYAYTERRVFLECIDKQIIYSGLSLEEEFKFVEYKYKLQFQNEICLQTSANYLYLNMTKLEEYYRDKILYD
jgi:hypothetical protein